jgi:hypothetical protein
MASAAAASLLLMAGCGGTQGIPDQLRLNPGAGSEPPSNLLRQAAADLQGSTGGNSQAPIPIPPASDGTTRSNRAFCRDIIDELSQLPNLFNASSPEDLKSQLDRMRAKNPQILAEAPASMKGSVQTVLRFEDRIYNDATSNQQDIANAVASSTFQTAFLRLQRYAMDNCGSSGRFPDTTPTT